jgi:hypothetical protein
MPSSSDKVGIVSANHGHTATITSAQLMAGGDLSLDITGTSDHPHTVQLTGADLTQIGDGQRVSKVSSNDDAHTHGDVQLVSGGATASERPGNSSRTEPRDAP